MAPQKRDNKNKQYPTNWRLRKRGGSFYISFRVPTHARHLWDGKAEVLLGKGDTAYQAEQKAYEIWSQKISAGTTPITMQQAIDRYEASVVPEKSPATQKSNRYSIKRLRSVIPANMPVTEFRTHHAYEYRDQCARLESPKKANLDIEVLSHLFTKCFEWGVPGLIEHPIRGKIKKISIAPRSLYASDEDVRGFMDVAGKMLNVYIPLKIALGIDKSMMLGIQISDIKKDRLSVNKRRKIAKNPNAKGKDYLFEDSDGNSTGLRELLDDVFEWRKKHVKILSPWLFCTSQGKPYLKEDGDTSGFNSIWQRKMRQAIEQEKVKTRFTEHDLCAKTASDAETLEEAAKLRGHLNKATTHKVYRRKNEAILPFKKKG